MRLHQQLEKKIVAFSGAHGTGKTTAVYGTAHGLKLLHKSKEVGIVAETARACPLGCLSDGRQLITAVSQRWIFAAQVVAELDAAARFDLVVSDRTVMDAIAYTVVGGFADLADGMLRIARQHAEVYREIHFMPVSDNGFLTRDGVRDVNREAQLRVEEALLEIYRALGLESRLIFPPVSGEGRVFS